MAHLTGVAVRKIRTLHHQHIGDPAHRINPRLRAPRTAVAEAAGREHRRHALVRRAQDAGAETPAVVRAAIAGGGVLEKARRQVAGLRGGEEFHRVGAQVAAAFERAAAEEHLAEARVVAWRRVESAVALRRAVARAKVGARWHGFEHTGVLVFRVGGDEFGTLPSGRVESRVLHPQRIEEALLEKRVEGHPAHHLHDARGGVDAALRVAPLCAGIVLHRCGEPERDQIGERPGLHRRGAGRLAETGGMREELRDREIRRLARRRLQLGKLRQIFRHRIGDVQFAFILQHENRRAGDRLRHRGDPEKRVRRHRPLRRHIGQAGALKMEDLVLRDDHRDRTGDFVFRHHLLNRGTDSGEHRFVGESELREAKSGGESEMGGKTKGVHGEDSLFCDAAPVPVTHVSVGPGNHPSRDLGTK